MNSCAAWPDTCKVLDDNVEVDDIDGRSAERATARRPVDTV